METTVTMPRRRFLLLLPALVLSGCVGTDRILDPAGAEVAQVVVRPSVQAVSVGDSVGFAAEARNDRGEILPGRSVAWVSSDAAIASIDPDGTAHGHQSGQATITAEAEGIRSAPALLSVVADPGQVSGIVVSPDHVILRPGDTARLTAVALNLAGDPLPGRVFDWQSGDPAVVAVDAQGMVVALAPGVAGITASTEGLSSPPAAVEVVGLVRTGTILPGPVASEYSTGSMRLEQTDSGGLVLVLGPDFRSVPGPGLYVFLSHGNYVSSGSLNLGPLQSTSGSQTYPVPAGVALTEFDWVIVQCVPFNVLFGRGELGEPQ